MRIIKVITKVDIYQVKSVSVHPMNWGEFKARRKRLGLKWEELSTCFRCAHKYDNKEGFHLSILDKSGNKTLCSKCAREFIEEQST